MSIKNKIVAIGALALFLSCATNPFTGKKTLALVPNSQLFPTAFAQYDQFLTENNVVTGTADAEDKTVNAWCMPGGKIVFYTGILPIAQNETGIAAIMGHEVAHALANHGQQRMSAGMLQQLGAVAGNVAIKDAQTRNIFNQAYGIGSNVGVMLPFSRSHETQSDQIGLHLMAIAGYNPEEASELWKRMKANSGGQAPPEFLSTHPSNDTRISNLEQWAPKAKAEAKKFGVDSFRPLGNF